MDDNLTGDKHEQHHSETLNGLDLVFQQFETIGVEHNSVVTVEKTAHRKN